MKKLLLVALGVALMSTTASAVNWGDSPYASSYTNTTGGTVYVLNQPTSWAVTGSPGEVVTTLTGAGPSGTDAYYRSGASGGVDDSTIAMWDFTGVPASAIPNVSPNLVPGEYKAQMYVSDYGGLPHENDGVYGSSNGPWGMDALGLFSSWDGVPQAATGWTNESTWIGGYVWLSNDGWSNGVYGHMTVGAKWNPWGAYGGLAVSGVRVSTNGDFAPLPEPASMLLLVAGGLLLNRRRHA